MKLAMVVISSFVTVLSNGQAITLDNTWLAGSKTIFIGVENKLILRGNVQSLVSFQSNKASIERAGDTLIVKPAQPGPLEIILKTRDQTITNVFTVGYLPMFGLIITDDSADIKD